MTLSIIVAHCKNHVIGASGTMPWHLPADLAHFKSVTMGSPVIMGSNTYKSIGRPLPGRLNIVITSKATSCENIPDRLIHVENADEALKIAGKYDEVFIIGGGSVYRQFMDRADRMYITLIDATPEGDTFFPEYSTDNFKIISSEHREPDEKNCYAMDFITYEKI